MSAIFAATVAAQSAARIEMVTGGDGTANGFRRGAFGSVVPVTWRGLTLDVINHVITGDTFLFQVLDPGAALKQGSFSKLVINRVAVPNPQTYLTASVVTFFQGTGVTSWRWNSTLAISGGAQEYTVDIS